MDSPQAEQRARSVAAIRSAAGDGGAAVLCPPDALAAPLALLVAEGWPRDRPIPLLTPPGRSFPCGLLGGHAVETTALPAAAPAGAMPGISCIVAAEPPPPGWTDPRWLTPLDGFSEAGLAALRRAALPRAEEDGPELAATVMLQLRRLGYL